MRLYRAVLHIPISGNGLIFTDLSGLSSYSEKRNLIKIVSSLSETDVDTLLFQVVQYLQTLRQRYKKCTVFLVIL